MKSYIFTGIGPLIERYEQAFPEATVIAHKPSPKEFDIIVGDDPVTLMIPSVFNNTSASSYDGVETALWSYLTIVRKNSKSSRVIILSHEDKASFLTKCNLSGILFCPNVFFVENRKDRITRLMSRLKTNAWESADVLESLKLLRITPPSAFLTSHTITNEWSIMRWSRYLGINTPGNLLQDNLYFNYLKTIYPIGTNKALGQFDSSISGKVLVIDDEIGKGWNAFYGELFRRFPRIEYEGMGEEFKRLSQEAIKETCLKKINQFDPDVIFVDLRLHESDFARVQRDDVDSITGIQLIRDIKKDNPGIQIIGITASNKIWNYQMIQSMVDGYIIKESPEASRQNNYTKNAIASLIGNLSKCLDRVYLKGIHKDIQNLDARFEQFNEDDEFQRLSMHLKMAFHLENVANDKEQMAFAYIELFQSFELIIRQFYDISVEEGEIDSIANKINRLYYDTWSQRDDSFRDVMRRLADARNAFVHQDIKKLNTARCSIIYSKEGFQLLFSHVKMVCSLLLDDYLSD